MTKIINTGVPQPSPEALSSSAAPAAAKEPAAVQAPATGIASIQGDDAAHALRVSAKQILAQTGLNIELSASEVAFVESLNSSQLDQLQSVTNAFSATVNAAVSDSGGATTGVKVSALEGPLQDRWSAFVSDMKIKGGATDVNALVQWVLRDSYQETTKDLYFYAEKVKFYNNIKKDIRAELQRARDVWVDYAGKDETTALSTPFKATPPATEFTGATEGTATQPHDDCTTKAELETYIQEMEESLSSVGDDAQLANVDLQNMLQKQQQTMQMMSNIAKMLHDTAMAIIRKMGG